MICVFLFIFHILQCIRFIPLLITSHVLVPVTYALVCFRGTTRHRGGRRLGRLAGSQTQRCGYVRCNSTSMSGRDTASTERLVETLLGRRRTTLAQWFDDVRFVGKCLIQQNEQRSAERDVTSRQTKTTLGCVPYKNNYYIIGVLFSI